MSLLQDINLDYAQAERDLVDFKAFLKPDVYYSEAAVVRELKAKPHLASLIGSMVPGVPKPNVYKFEFQIAGVFRADLVAGNSQQNSFIFVEFEPAEKHSLFGPGGTNQMRAWSHQLEHGFGQLVDWGCTIQDVGKTDTFKNALGTNGITRYISLLVCGRDHSMDAAEKKRFSWRSDNVSLQGSPSACMTYDGLVIFLESQIAAIKSYNNAP